MSLAATVNAMAKSGCSAQQIAAVVAAHEAVAEAKAIAKRAKDADRQMRKRKGMSEMSRGHCVTPRDTTDTPSPSPSFDKEIPPTPPKEIKSYPAPAPTHTYAREAVSEFRAKLAREYSNAGHLAPDTGRAVTWLASGWDETICVEAVRAGLAKAGRFLPLKYFDGQIADAHAPVPIGQARASPNSRAGPRDLDAAFAKVAATQAEKNNERAYYSGTTIEATALTFARES